MDQSILEKAAQRFNLSAGNLALISDVENFVYDNSGETPCILRISHSSHRSRDALLGELEWQKYLLANGVPVPDVIRSVNGELVEGVESGKTHFLVSAFHKIPGKTILEMGECQSGIFTQ